MENNQLDVHKEIDGMMIQDAAEKIKDANEEPGEYLSFESLNKALHRAIVDMKQYNYSPKGKLYFETPLADILMTKVIEIHEGIPMDDLNTQLVSFLGINVVENDLVPDNIAILTDGHEIYGLFKI